MPFLVDTKWMSELFLLNLYYSNLWSFCDGKCFSNFKDSILGHAGNPSKQGRLFRMVNDIWDNYRSFLRIKFFLAVRHVYQLWHVIVVCGLNHLL